MSAVGLTETSLRATGIGLMVLTSLVVGFRTVLRAGNKTSVRWHDGWLLVGYLFFIAVSSIYVAKAGLLFRLSALQEGQIAPYPNLGEDDLEAKYTFFFTNPGMWVTLWSIKFSLLAFYKKVMVNISLYTKMWWVVLAYCIVTLIVSVVLHVTACNAWFQALGCRAPNDIRNSSISLWEGYAADMTSDLMIMLLPIGLIRNLQMPAIRKWSIGALFGLGALCMLASTLRVVQVGKTTGSGNKQPSLTWMALWSIIESSIAIIVGCGPGFYRKAVSVSRSRETPYYNVESHTKISKGRDQNGTEGGLVPLHPIVSNTICPGGMMDSREELVGIRVSKKFSVVEESRG